MLKMHDQLETTIPENSIRELEYDNSTTIKVKYLLSTVTIKATLQYNIASSAEEDYNQLLSGLLPGKSPLYG